MHRKMVKSDLISGRGRIWKLGRISAGAGYDIRWNPSICAHFMYTICLFSSVLVSFSLSVTSAYHGSLNNRVIHAKIRKPSNKFMNGFVEVLNDFVCTLISHSAELSFNDTCIYLALRCQIHAKREQLIYLVNVLHRFRSFRVKNTNSHPKLNIIRTFYVKAC